MIDINEINKTVKQWMIEHVIHLRNEDAGFKYIGG